MTRLLSLPAVAVSAMTLDSMTPRSTAPASTDPEVGAHRSRRRILAGMLVAGTIAGTVVGAPTAGAEPLSSLAPTVIGSGLPGLPGMPAEGVRLDTPRLATADNFRDVAGIDHAYAAGDSTLRPGVFYRSNALQVDDADLAILEDLGIRTVIDLRTDAEAEATPDRIPVGAQYVHLSVLGDEDSAADTGSVVSALESPAGAAKMLEDANVQFVENPTVRQNLGEVFRTLATADGPVLFHCTAGKDRAGWVSAVLQLAAGVSREDVMANYLATNDYTKDRIDASVAQLRAAKGDQMADAYAVLMGVQPSFLQAGLDAMDRDFGGVAGYLTEGLGLDAGTVQQLTAKLGG